MTMYLLLILLLLVILHIFLRYNKNARMIDKIPGPTPLPFIGNLLIFNSTPEKVWLKINQLLYEYGGLVRVWGTMIFGVFSSHPDDLKIILSCKKNLNKCMSGYENIRFSGNDGLLFSKKDKWQHRRKMMNPAFHRKLLEVYTEITDEHVSKTINKLNSYENGSAVNAMSTCAELTLGVICESIMGVNIDFLSPGDKLAYRHAFDVLCEITYHRATRPYIRDWMMKFLSIGRRQKDAFRIIRNFTIKIIQERKEYIKQVGSEAYRRFINEDEEDLTDLPVNRKRLCVLDLLLEARMENMIDDEGIEEEIDVFVAAGYDTTGITTAFALLLLAENKEAQDKARAEVIKVIKECDGKITLNDLQKMEYLDRCVKEALRLFPAVPMFGRSIVDEIQLKDHKLPVSSEMIIIIFALHRDPRFWPDPLKFDPDRFLPENVQNRHPYAYLPFSFGSRNCIGQKFAMMEMKLALARVLQNFILEPVESTNDVKFVLHVTLKPNKPIFVRFVKIDSQQIITE